jgi:hypothetical protein
MRAEERRARAARIRELMAHEDIQAVFAEIEQDIVSEWRRTPWFWKQKAKWNELKGLERFKARLASFANH